MLQDELAVPCTLGVMWITCRLTYSILTLLISTYARSKRMQRSGLIG